MTDRDNRFELQVEPAGIRLFGALLDDPKCPAPREVLLLAMEKFKLESLGLMRSPGIMGRYSAVTSELRRWADHYQSVTKS